MHEPLQGSILLAACSSSQAACTPHICKLAHSLTIVPRCVLSLCSDDDDTQRVEQDGFGPRSYHDRMGHNHRLLDHLAVSGYCTDHAYASLSGGVHGTGPVKWHIAARHGMPDARHVSSSC